MRTSNTVGEGACVRAVAERGFSLMEAMVAALVAVIAVLGLAYSFGLGHGLIDGFAASRAALGEAQRSMERLSALSLSNPDLALGTHTSPFTVTGVTTGTVKWVVEPYDDPLTPSITQDLRRVTVSVGYNNGLAPDTVHLVRLFQNP